MSEFVGAKRFFFSKFLFKIQTLAKGLCSCEKFTPYLLGMSIKMNLVLRFLASGGRGGGGRVESEASDFYRQKNWNATESIQRWRCRVQIRQEQSVNFAQSKSDCSSESIVARVQIVILALRRKSIKRNWDTEKIEEEAKTMKKTAEMWHDRAWMGILEK